MRRPLFTLIAALGCLAGCSERSIDVGVPLSLTLSEDGGGRVVSIANCGVHDEFNLDRECMIGSDAKAYTVNGDLPVLPAAPPYGVFLHFKNGFAPDPDDVQLEGAVKAYATPTNVESRHPLPEDSEANRVGTHIVMPDERGVLVSMDNPVSPPIQISVVFDFQLLYRSRSTALAAINPGSSSEGIASLGYTARFYVGSVPPNDAPCPPTPQACSIERP